MKLDGVSQKIEKNVGSCIESITSNLDIKSCEEGSAVHRKNETEYNLLHVSKGNASSNVKDGCSLFFIKENSNIIIITVAQHVKGCPTLDEYNAFWEDPNYMIPGQIGKLIDLKKIKQFVQKEKAKKKGSPKEVMIYYNDV